MTEISNPNTMNSNNNMNTQELVVTLADGQKMTARELRAKSFMEHNSDNGIPPLTLWHTLEEIDPNAFKIHVYLCVSLSNSHNEISCHPYTVNAAFRSHQDAVNHLATLKDKFRQMYQVVCESDECISSLHHSIYIKDAILDYPNNEYPDSIYTVQEITESNVLEPISGAIQFFTSKQLADKYLENRKEREEQLRLEEFDPSSNCPTTHEQWEIQTKFVQYSCQIL